MAVSIKAWGLMRMSRERESGRDFKSTGLRILHRTHGGIF